ncbi:alanine--tRNA ligase [Methylobacterium sp. J-068]|uniref:alanine--tRNA ligase n=1 Tax=Methylobacterium sp. J-068 TaxID=2836649 RepID=UPI001FBB0E72|nr:alanine--tRNA ligase [Methylobacterium sp. J-068]MCJ2034357.1 alanine--tRNA ligase [Methylobacterium sp. J-068]
MSGVNEIRSTFLDYFAAAGHEVVPSSSLVPRNDPTLMFTNAGMVQFKNVFTGVEKRPYDRATTAQKCVRAGGKHNDLDNVGYTARHHTFFEMLGNFSFGDYFKPRAIELAWNLITKEFGLSKDRLLVTVYADDDEAAGLWRKIAGFSDDRIIRIGTSDNFWQMGDTGPCGPCSEIFIDQGPALRGGPPGSPDEDGDRFLEFWNLVFMQYEQIEPGNRLALPRPSIDTGLGLERMAAILQGVNSNYETDLFRALIDAVSHAVGRPPEPGNVASYRVIADHLRAASFLVADGVLPGNEGRGYVLRRIMRRAMRHAELLGSREPMMYRLVPTLLREMGQAYPELTRAEGLIAETLRLEETRFRRTLERGLAILDAESRDLSHGQNLSGETAFTLYDTYGFPLDLTQDALKARGIGVDTDAFGQAMERQRKAARAAWTGSGEAATETVWYGLKERVGATEFLGYETETAEGIVTALLREGAETDGLEAGETGLVLLNQTPFYAESGGQVGDTGTLSAAGLKARVTATEKKLGDLFVHHVTVDEGTLAPNQAVELAVDHARRSAIRANHSATHLLHEALRQVLGDHVAQKGSLVSAERLRFDFSHPKPMDEAEIRAVEDIANAVLLQNTPVVTKLMAQEEAIESGARALFGEKYGDEVRVVSMGEPVAGAPGRAKAFSVELCGGTHARRTGEIGQVSVVGESAVGAGVRRIEALTAGAARRHRAEESRTLAQIAGLLKASPTDVPDRLASLIEDRRRLERDLTDARKKIAMGGAGSGADDGIAEIGGVKVMARVVEGVEMRDLKSLADEGKTRLGSGIVAIVGVAPDGKAGLVVGVTPDLTERYDAVALVRAGAGHLGGKGGGGRRDMAQAGGPEGAGAQAAIDAIQAALSA